MESRDRMLTLVVVLVFAWGALSQALHLEPVIGAFAIGVLLGRLRRLPADVIKKLSAVTLGVFAPIFFAVAGLKVDVRSLLRPRLIAITLVVLAVATVGKVVGVYVGARWISRQDHWTALAYGFGLNARGAVELIVATIGLSLGILTQEVFSMVVVMAIVTSLMAPFSLRLILRRVEQDPEEARRLRRQEATEGGLLGELHRVLVPIRPRSHPVGPVQTIEAAVLERLGEGAGLGVTLLSVTDPAGRPAAAAHLAEVRSLFDRIGEVTVRVLTAQQPVQAVLREAANDYDLLVIGTPEPSLDADLVFGRFVDDLVKLSPCPTLVVRGWPVTPGWQPRRLLVPADGTGPGRSAAELAFAMAGADSQVTVVHVITPHPSPVMAITDRSRRHRLATEMTGQLLDLGASLEVLTWSDVREAEDVEAGILAAVVDTGADLLVLGTAVRAGTSRLFLGPRVERLLERVPCPVLVLNR
jgi:nucleotide-binding universal stress UspA family protein